MVESRNFLKSNRGQGTIEYVLLLVITITMIMLAMGQIFKPLGTFMQDYMGTYVACMLSSGELPGLQSENKLKEANAKCSVSFNGTGSSTNGNNPNGNNGSNGQNGADGDANAANKNGKNANNKNGKNGSGSGDGSSQDGSGSSGGSTSYAGTQSRKTMFGRSRVGSSDAGSDFGDGEGSKKRYVSNLNTKGDKFYRQRNQVQSLSSNGRGLAISGFTEEMKKKQERKIQSEPRVLAKTENEEFSRPERKSIVKPPPPSKKVEALKDEEFSMGNYFKYILIAVIILLIIILGGGQMFEMSKSYD